MSEQCEVKNLDNPKNFLNRELSWLDFNFRVLAEAENPDLPPLDRLKFIAIVSSNLDEFTTVRIANTIRAHKEGVSVTDPAGLTPQQVLEGMAKKKHSMYDRQYRCLLQEILPKIREEGIELVRPENLSDDDRKFLSRHFTEEISPALTPMAIDPGHPFPLLTSGAVYLLFHVRSEEHGSAFFNKTDTVLVQMPGGMNRFLKLPSRGGKVRMAALDDVIRLFSSSLLGGYVIEGAYAFRILRDAEMTVDDGAAEDLLGAIDEAVRSRRWGEPITLEVSGDMPAEVVDYLRRELGIGDDNNLYRIPWLLDLKSFFGFIGQANRPDLMEDPWPPRQHPAFRSQKDIFTVMREGDHILSLPYHKFDPVVSLVSAAADDPSVLAIKITLYRVSGDSPLVKSLIRAARNGKQITALVELRARFDEAANISWAKALDSAGAHVIYGVVGYKTHSKVLLVVRKEKDGIRRYVHLGTGNYNDKTAKLYTDLGLLTTRPEIGQDVSGFFNVITGYSLPPRWNCLTMAPTDMRNKVISLIRREVEKHTPELPGNIRAKMNSLIDPAVIKELYKASQKGVKVQLLVRGLCRLRAGVPGLSDNITVRSILDRYLEHPRIFHFHNGSNEEVYMASADWMERNFDQRLELLFPVDDPECRKIALETLDLGFADNVKAWEMDINGEYHRVDMPDKKAKQLRSQEEQYKLACKRIKSKVTTPEGTFIAKSSPTAASL